MNPTDNGWIQNLPWLYYETDTRDVMREHGRFDMRMTFDKNSER